MTEEGAISESFKELYDAGLSDGEISRKTGETKNTVRRWRRWNGLPSHYQAKGGVKVHPCAKCIFYSPPGQHFRFCEYILIAETRRPCKGGDGCTVKRISATPEERMRIDAMRERMRGSCTVGKSFC